MSRRILSAIFFLSIGITTSIASPVHGVSEQDDAAGNIGALLLLHSTISLLPAATIYYANGTHAQFSTTYFGAWLGGAVGLGIGYIIIKTGGVKDSLGFGLAYAGLLATCEIVGGLIGAYIAYRSGESRSSTTPPDSRQDIAGLKFNFGF